MIGNQKQMEPKKAQAKLEELCSRAEHSEGELREKLRKWGVGGDDADKIMESLRSGRYVDDRRFAEAYVRDKYRFARWGKRKIAQGLATKRVSRDIVVEVLAEIDPEEYSGIAAEVLGAKMRQNPQLISTFEGRTKLFRFLISRGYEPSLASELLKAAYKSSQE